jgi:hypothetical protein
MEICGLRRPGQIALRNQELSALFNEPFKLVRTWNAETDEAADGCIHPMTQRMSTLEKRGQLGYYRNEPIDDPSPNSKFDPHGRVCG